MATKKYNYFVSFKCNIGTKSGFGNAIISNWGEIKTMDDIVEIQNHLISLSDKKDTTDLFINNFIKL